MNCTVMRQVVLNSAVCVVRITLMDTNHTNITPCHFTACLPSPLRTIHRLPVRMYACSVILRLEKQGRQGAEAVLSPGDNSPLWPEGAEEWLDQNQTFTLRWVGWWTVCAIVQLGFLC